MDYYTQEEDGYIIKRDAIGYSEMIIEKYAGFSKDGKVFPVRSNTVCNDSLKRIFQQIDYIKEKKVTFHLERHTFATLFLSEGVPLESLSKMLGHKNIATTQIYAKILNEKVGKDMQKDHINLKVWNALLLQACKSIINKNELLQIIV